jgi:hypothetical protein
MLATEVAALSAVLVTGAVTADRGGFAGMVVAVNGRVMGAVVLVAWPVTGAPTLVAVAITGFAETDCGVVGAAFVPPALDDAAVPPVGDTGELAEVREGLVTTEETVDEPADEAADAGAGTFEGDAPEACGEVLLAALGPTALTEVTVFVTLEVTGAVLTPRAPALPEPKRTDRRTALKSPNAKNASTRTHRAAIIPRPHLTSSDSLVPVPPRPRRLSGLNSDADCVRTKSGNSQRPRNKTVTFGSHEMRSHGDARVTRGALRASLQNHPPSHPMQKKPGNRADTWCTAMVKLAPQALPRWSARPDF